MMQIGTTTHSAASGAGHAAFEALKFNNGCYAITNALAANTLHEHQSAPCESPQLSAEYDAPPSQMHGNVSLMPCMHPCMHACSNAVMQ
jgi:hypothetical protein